MRQDIAAQVRGQHDDGVLEVHRAALAVGQPPVVEHLQQHVEDVLVRLLHLVEQDHLIGPAAHRLGQHAALVVADIARRRADQARHGVLLHELAHVDAHHGPLVVEQELRERLGQSRSCRRRLGRGTGSCRSAGSDPASPARARRTALATAVIASSWPTTRLRSSSSIRSSLARSPSSILSTGMPVQRETTAAMPSSVTASFTSLPSADFRQLAARCRGSRRSSSSRGAPQIAAALRHLDLAARLIQPLLQLLGLG